MALVRAGCFDASFCVEDKDKLIALIQEVCEAWESRLVPHKGDCP